MLLETPLEDVPFREAWETHGATRSPDEATHLAQRVAAASACSFEQALRGVRATIALYGRGPMADQVIEEFVSCSELP